MVNIASTSFLHTEDISCRGAPIVGLHADMRQRIYRWPRWSRCGNTGPDRRLRPSPGQDSALTQSLPRASGPAHPEAASAVARGPGRADVSWGQTARPAGTSVRSARSRRKTRLNKPNSHRTAEANKDDNQARTGKQPGRASCHAQPGSRRRPDPAAAERALRTLSPAECFGLLELGGIGRVGFAAADRDHDAAGQLRGLGEGHHFPRRS